MREIILIAAVGPKYLIGDGPRLPWRLPRDFRLFRRLTTGHPIIMGRRTFESLNSKPLPKRRNIVVTRNLLLSPAGVDIAHSIEDAIEMTPSDARVFIVGGGQLYRQAMPFATSIVLTEIFDESPNDSLFSLFSGDVYFPDIRIEDWQETKTSNKSYLAISKLTGYQSVKRKGLRFRVRRFLRSGLSVPRATRLPEAEIKQSLVVPREQSTTTDASSQSPLFD